MDMTSKPRSAPRPGSASRLLAPAAAFLATMLGLPAQAVVAIPETPMQTNNGVPPNLMFVLDDSGSMAWRYMYNPSVADLRNGTGVVASPTGDNRTRDSTYTSSNSLDLVAAYDQAHTTNTIYYNPFVTYRGWQRADGTFMGDTAYATVYSSNTLASGTTISLAANTQVFYTPLATATDLTDIRQYRRITFLADGTAQLVAHRQ
jgi:type IV pilus assembly protein PilY1